MTATLDKSQTRPACDGWMDRFCMIDAVACWEHATGWQYVCELHGRIVLDMLRHDPGMGQILPLEAS